MALDINYVERVATLVDANGKTVTSSLAAWRHLKAYVLLADPGAGKSSTMKQEADAVGGIFVSARDFIALGIPSDRLGSTLFIDGLDEMRAGSTDARAPLEAIRARLNELALPSFRISCREHDWRSQTDRVALERVASGGQVQELHLEPLTVEQQLSLLESQLEAGAAAAECFLDRARQNNIEGLLGNPLLLKLMVKAVKAGWPNSRFEIYEKACEEMSIERSAEHQQAKPMRPAQRQRILDDAGTLSAVLLLSGKQSLTQLLNKEDSSVEWQALPEELNLRDPAAALASSLFTTVSELSFPLHRSIAEYLGAASLAKKITEGLPIGRVLALMQGFDAGIVEPLRGLFGWLAAHLRIERGRLIDVDPLSIVLNGDIARFSADEKRALLSALRRTAEQNPWFRNGRWHTAPFAPLATPDLASELIEVLVDHSNNQANQALVACILDALESSPPVEALRDSLEAWVEDGVAPYYLRSGALRAWKRLTGPDTAKGQIWLEQFRSGVLQDFNARLTSEILSDLYPSKIGPDNVFDYWPKAGDVASNHVLPRFWYGELTERTQGVDAGLLADAWLRASPVNRDSRHDSEWLHVCSHILAGALEQCGDSSSDERVYDWLGMGLDKYGFSRLDKGGALARVAKWLSDRPELSKRMVMMGWVSTNPDPSTSRFHFWSSEQRLHGSQLPADWYFWKLKQVPTAVTKELAEYCLQTVARAVLDAPPGMKLPSMEEVEWCVQSSQHIWPDAGAWLRTAWACNLEDSWRSDDFSRRKKQGAKALADRENRRAALKPHMNAIFEGTAAPHVMDRLVGAYEGRFFDIRGETPEQKVADFLGSDGDTATQAIGGIELVLKRSDLPEPKELLALEGKGKRHFLQIPALLAAKLSFGRNPDVVDSWSDPVAGMLVASWLTYGLGETPTWYLGIASKRANLVAPLLIQSTLTKLKGKNGVLAVGLRELATDSDNEELARLVLPAIVSRFPHRPSDAARRELSISILPALQLLDPSVASRLLTQRLAKPGASAIERVNWLVGALPYIDKAVELLVETVGNNERRAVGLGIALRDQSSVARGLKDASPETLSRLIELLAPLTKPSRPDGSHWVGDAEDRGDTVRTLIERLAANPNARAAESLFRLSTLPRMEPWKQTLHVSMIAQTDVAREASFVHASPAAVAFSLANGAPANAADLQALGADHIGEVEKSLRGADTFRLKLFWRENTNGAIVPKTENDCRDLLLHDLRPSLTKSKVNIIPERRAANEKRADLGMELAVDGRVIAVPIEIKKEDNRDVWVAWQSQLQRLYLTNPASKGYGIYLILWFGVMPRPSPDGKRPGSPEDMRKMLYALISSEARARLKIIVLDLSITPK